MHLKPNISSRLREWKPISFQLECDLFRDSNGVLCFAPHKYIDKMVQTYMNIFGTKPKLHKYFRSPLEQGNNPELDTL